MKTYLLIAFFIVTNGTLVAAQTYKFELVWSKIRSESPGVASSRLQAEALGEAYSRASRHWLPRVYLDAKTYQTNDPGAAFFGQLEQRSLAQTDFDPDSINNPDTQVFTRGALGLDLPLYEGGMKSAQADVYKHSLNAQASTTSQTEVEQYSLVGLCYASISILEQQKTKLQSLQAEISRMIKGYQLGSKSNPVGYSGLLGMKSLANRLSGLIDQYESQARAQYATLSSIGFKESAWKPEPVDTIAFVERYFHAGDASESEPSFKTAASRESAAASEELSNMEKAKFLPKIGAFAETFVFKGDRATEHGYDAGLYLQWNLFNPSDYGSLREAKLKSIAASKSAEAISQQDGAERAVMLETVESLISNLRLLNDSDTLLAEQARMTSTLFRNGSINALQTVEILSRRTDLIVQQNDAQIGLIKAASQAITKQKFDIDQQLALGTKK